MPHLQRRARGFPGPLLALTLIFCVGIQAPRLASAEASRRAFTLHAGVAEATLEVFSEQADVSVVYPLEDVRGVATNPVHGSFAARDALERLVAGTALEVMQDDATGVFMIKLKRPVVPRPDAAGSPNRTQPTDIPQTRMKTKNPFSLLIASLGLSALLNPVHAADTQSGGNAAVATHLARGIEEHAGGRVGGFVSNAATGNNLEGAEIMLHPGGMSALTTRDGRFAFPRLAPGDYTLTASYSGLDSKTVSVRVVAGQASDYDIGLTAGIYRLSEFVVSGEREGNALAVTQQRHAPNVKNVIASDAFGNVADQNITNLLARLPGVSEFMDEGEATRVLIRGISPDMNAVTVDGTRGASATTGAFNRGFSLDRIPADFVAQVEVTKAQTPDMDGDSIGGAINLRTKSPLDHNGRSISYSAGASWNLDRSTFDPIGSLYYSDILGREKKAGLLLTGSYNKTYKPRDSVYLNWEPTADTTRTPYYWFADLGEDRLAHERVGIGARLDYKLSPSHRVFINTMYSYYMDTLDRRRRVIAITPAQVRPGWTDTVTETINHAVDLNQNHRKRVVETVNMTFGGEMRVADSILDYGLNYSASTGTEDRVIPIRAVNGVGYRFDRSQEAKRPTTRQISGLDVENMENQVFRSLTLLDFDDTDTIKGLHFNWRKQFSSVAPASLKTGIRYRGQERDRRQKQTYYSYVGPDGVAGINPVTRVNDDNLIQFYDPGYQYRPDGGRYDPMGSVDPDRIVAHLRANPGQYVEDVVGSVRDSLRVNGVLTEDVYAAYIMGGLKLGALDILGGVRVEETRLNSKGNRQEITADERGRRAAWVGPVTPDELRRRTTAEWSNRSGWSSQYRDVLPSLHFKYHVSEGLMTRASYSTGTGRPNFSDLLRGTTVNHDARTITAANPSLQPQYADNFDLTVEYYFKPASFVSAGVFLKEIKDFIYGDQRAVVGAGSDNGFGGDYVGYALTSQFNGGSARVRGFELAYQQRMVWLPGIWQGLGLTANYTRLESRGNYNSNGTTIGGELANFTPETLNVGLSYTYRSWDVRLKMSYRDRNLFTASSNPLQRVYRYPKRNYDINLQYNWRPKLSFFVDVINVFNDPIDDTYIYLPSRHRHSQIFTTAIKFGVSGRL